MQMNTKGLLLVDHSTRESKLHLTVLAPCTQRMRCLTTQLKQLCQRLLLQHSQITMKSKQLYILWVDIWLKNLEAMISAFLGGIGEYSQQVDIEHLFKQCDTDDSGYIDREEFAYLVFSMKTDTNTDLTTSNWESKPMSRAFSLRKRRLTTYSSERTRMIGDESTVRYMKNMVNDIERPLADWSMFYCGTSTPIVKSLCDIEKKYHIGLGIEKFDW